MFLIDSHNRGIKDYEKQIMSNALCKGRIFILNQPIYMCVYKNTARRSLYTKMCVQICM